ncbi:uncharacterized protein LOC106071009 [Biomphalaria glabrata]|uniref:Uncharacterized protein LOC106071009 n=1 Tax=Biomphalaria glabrata TaxID=6526 RepID=A0A9W3A8Z0_BIOGL|nr:uncharacterized protein LOC106071009 [Biomphalaria glabrata]
MLPTTKQKHNVSGCLSKQRSCLFSYVDNVIWVERNVNQTDAVCQQLSDFAQCLLNDSTCTNQTQVTSIVTNEQMMKNIQPTSACIIPSFKKSYTFEECYKAVLQCQTIPLGYENSPEFCSKVQDTVRCVVGLNCANDALLRVSNVLYNTAVKNISSACALDNLYPLGKPGLTACQTSRRDCTNTYVDQVLTRETDTDKCKDLNSYITCLSKSSSCNTTSELKLLSEEEIQRAEVKACSLTALNGAPSMTWSWLVISSVLLFLFNWN